MYTSLAIVTADATGRVIPGVACYLRAPELPGGFIYDVTNNDGYASFAVPIPFSGVLKLSGAAQAYGAGGNGETVHVTGESVTLRVGPTASNPQDVLLPPCVPFKRASVLPTPPTRDEKINVGLTFQGLLYDTKQFGMLPGFEACLPWLTPEDRQVVYVAKRASRQGDTHCIITIPDGVPLYDEPNQAYSPDKFGPLDWTSSNTVIGPELPALIREVIGAGFHSILLYLGGDSPANYEIGMKQLDLLHACDDYRDTLWRYCTVVPGWDGIFYGWSPEQIINWGLKFRRLFPDPTATAALHYSAGHIPVGEGGADYLPRTGDPYRNPGRMADFDLLIGEYDYNLHQDSTWQILNRLEAVYIRPADQLPWDDPSRAYYLGTPSPRGRWGHFAMEFGEYEAVRCGSDFAGMVAYVNQNRAYMYSMGAVYVG